MIAITGGNGPIAKYLIASLLEQGKPVRVLCTEPLDIKHELLTTVYGDVFDVTSLEELMDGAGQVYHLDGLHTFQPKTKSALYRENTEGTANVVNIALSTSVTRILYRSTMHSLGDKCPVRPYDETTKWNNIKTASGYGWSMHLAEREIWRGISEGLEGIIVHAGSVISHPSDPLPSNELLNFCLGLKQSYPVGHIHMIDIRDLVRVMIALMESNAAKDQFIAFSESLSYKALISRMAEHLSRNPPAKEISYISLRNRALLRKLFFLNRHSRPMLSKALAKVLSDPRSFSNQKISELIAPEFIDMVVTIQSYCSLYGEPTA